MVLSIGIFGYLADDKHGQKSAIFISASDHGRSQSPVKDSSEPALPDTGYAYQGRIKSANTVITGFIFFGIPFFNYPYFLIHRCVFKF
jgi:hypothetical protein